MGISLSEAAKKAIDANNFAHVATLMKDGSPQVSPVWIYRDGDDVMISTGMLSTAASNGAAAGIAKIAPAIISTCRAAERGRP